MMFGEKINMQIQLKNIKSKYKTPLKEWQTIEKPSVKMECD
jgi:hypothetical protein